MYLGTHIHTCSGSIVGAKGMTALGSLISESTSLYFPDSHGTAEQFGIAVFYHKPDPGAFGFLVKTYTAPPHRHPEVSPSPCLSEGISFRSLTFLWPLPRSKIKDQRKCRMKSPQNRSAIHNLTSEPTVFTQRLYSQHTHVPIPPHTCTYVVT